SSFSSVCWSPSPIASRMRVTSLIAGIIACPQRSGLFSGAAPSGRTADQFLERVAGVLRAVLLPHLPRDFLCPRCIPRITEKLTQFAGGATWRITVTRNRSGDSQPDNPVGIIGLVPGAGHHECRAAGAQRQARRANSAVMYDCCGSRKELRERGIVE